MQRKITFVRIQALRFVAAAAVVGYHTQVTTGTYFGGTDPYPLLKYASHGVDLFFVISGFIIVFVASTRETTATLFAKRRIERIVPLYWLMTLAMFALTHVPGIARNGASSPLHLLQSLFFMSWINGPATYPVLNVGWTLEFEMLFYATIVVAMMLTRHAWLAAAAVMLTLVATGRGTSFFLQNPIMIEFVFGMTIATFLSDRRTCGWMLAATLLVLSTLPMTEATRQVWMFGLPSAIIVAGAIYLDTRRGYRSVVLPELGNASYSIYLTHVIAISFACKIVAILVPQASRIVVIPSIALFAVAVGYAVYRLIEKRLIALNLRRNRSGAHVEASAGVVTIDQWIEGEEKAPFAAVLSEPLHDGDDHRLARVKTKAL